MIRAFFHCSLPSLPSSSHTQYVFTPCYHSKSSRRSVPCMGAVLISSISDRRIASALAWLQSRGPAEELLVIGATLDAANELARSIVHSAGSVFGWHRLSLAQLAATLAKPRMAAAGVVPVGQLGVVATVSRAIHRL